MKSGLILAAATFLVLPYSTAFFPGVAGNPEREPYLGKPGSLYDATINPPHTDGVVAYDPNAPLPKGAADPQPAPGMGIAPGTKH